MNTTVLILLVLLIIYVPLWFYVWKHPSALRYGLEKYGPTIKINSRLGIRIMDRLSRYRRFWRFFGVLSQVISLLLMVMMVYIMAVAVIRLPTTLSAGGMGIEYVLAIPGLNPLLPFWFGLLGLIIAMVCHEMAHGFQSRSNDIEVKHTGVLYGVVPLGAFVEPDEEQVEKASRRAKLDLYTAGITTNFILGAIAFLLFSTVMLGGMSSSYNDNCAVYQVAVDSPADGVIPVGVIITEVDGNPFLFDDGYYETPKHFLPGSLVTVTYLTSDYVPHDQPFRWGLYINNTVEGGPGDILKNTWIESIELGGKTYYFYTAQGFSSFMNLTRPGDTVTVNYVRADGTSDHADITLGTKGSIGYLGVYSSTSGMAIVTPGMVREMGANPLYGAADISSAATSMLSYIGQPFRSFDPIPESLQWWFGDQPAGFWIFCHILYWIFWLNIMLGITNALPAFPFDGGFVFLGWMDALYEKMGVKDPAERERKAGEIARNVSTLMLFLFVLVVIAVLI